MVALGSRSHDLHLRVLSSIIRITNKNGKSSLRTIALVTACLEKRSRTQAYRFSVLGRSGNETTSAI